MLVNVIVYYHVITLIAMNYIIYNINTQLYSKLKILLINKLYNLI